MASDHPLKLQELSPADKRWQEAFPVLQQLRPSLARKEFTEVYQEGYDKERLQYAAVFDANGNCQAVIGWRIMHKTVASMLYIDDLIVSETEQRHGLGRKIMAEMERKAKEAGCKALCLDTARPKAKEFYKAIGMTKAAALFAKSIAKN